MPSKKTTRTTKTPTGATVSTTIESIAPNKWNVAVSPKTYTVEIGPRLHAALMYAALIVGLVMVLSLFGCGPLHIHLKTTIYENCPTAEADDGLVITLPEPETNNVVGKK